VSFLLRVDHGLRAWIVTHRIGWLDQPIFLLSAAGLYGALWVVIALVLALFGRMLWRDVGRLALVLIVATVVIDFGLKPAIHRVRPFESTPDILVIGRHSDTASFPSGHTATAVAGAFVFTRVFPAGAAIWWLFAAAVGYSRIYLGVHYPADVVAGATVGAACALGVWRLTKGR
jgi:undecaprenyl-diphosphatase